MNFRGVNGKESYRTLWSSHTSTKASCSNIHAAKFYLKTQAGWREDAPVELYQPDDDRTWKIEIMQANADGTIEPTDRVVELARPD